MVTRTTGNSHNPGTGARSPNLVGRERERYKIEQALLKICQRPNKHGKLDQVGPALVLTGQRGMGKTALIEWAVRKADEMGVRCAFLREEKLGVPDCGKASDASSGEAIAKAAQKSTFSVTLDHPGLLGAQEEATKIIPELGLRSIIEDQLENGPMLLILDEAQKVSLKLLYNFCIMFQEFVTVGRPLALVMAGTPDLEGRFHSSGAIFMERSTSLRLTLLSRDEAQEFFSSLTAETGVPFEEDALEALVEWTDCHPLFIQMASEEAQKVAKDRGSGTFTLEDAKDALGAAEKRRQGFYNECCQAMVEEGLEPHALQAIELIETGPDKSVDYRKLIVSIQDANKDMDRRQAVDIVHSLIQHSFINDSRSRCTEGIPALFDYVKEQSTPDRPRNKIRTIVESCYLVRC